jgi:hypothetical protein
VGEALRGRVPRGFGKGGSGATVAHAAVPGEKKGGDGLGKMQMTSGPGCLERERKELQGRGVSGWKARPLPRAGPVRLVSLFFVLLIFFIYCFHFCLV